MKKLPTVTVIDVGNAKPTKPRVIMNREQRLAVTDHKMREKLVPAPPAIEKGEEAKWTLERAAQLEPFALREIEEQLLYSRDSKERRSAADKIIDMNGHGKREGQVGSGPIMVVMNVQPGQMPWHRTVDAKITADERRPLPSGTSSEDTAKEG